MIDHRCLRAVLNAVADAGLRRRSVVSWPDPFAQYQRRNFTPGGFLVYAVRDPKHFVFHADAAAVPSRRQTHYNDARAHPAGRAPPGCRDDVPTLCGTFAERGEGAMAVAAVRHGRRAVLVERNKAKAERARLRLTGGADAGTGRQSAVGAESAGLPS